MAINNFNVIFSLKTTRMTIAVIAREPPVVMGNKTVAATVFCAVIDKMEEAAPRHALIATTKYIQKIFPPFLVSSPHEGEPSVSVEEARFFRKKWETTNAVPFARHIPTLTYIR